MGRPAAAAAEIGPIKAGAQKEERKRMRLADLKMRRSAARPFNRPASRSVGQQICASASAGDCLRGVVATASVSSAALIDNNTMHEFRLARAQCLAERTARAP